MNFKDYDLIKIKYFNINKHFYIKHNIINEDYLEEILKERYEKVILKCFIEDFDREDKYGGLKKFLNEVDFYCISLDEEYEEYKMKPSIKILKDIDELVNEINNIIF